MALSLTGGWLGQLILAAFGVLVVSGDVSLSIVKTHVWSLQTSSARNRVEVAAWAYRSGRMDTDAPTEHSHSRHTGFDGDETRL